MTRPSRRSSNRFAGDVDGGAAMGVERVQRHAVAEVVERGGEGRGRGPLVVVHRAAPPARARSPSPTRRGGRARRGRGVVAGCPRTRPRRAPTRSARPPRLDRGVDVDVVALWLPAGAVEPDAQPGQRPAQRGRRAAPSAPDRAPGIAPRTVHQSSRAGTPAHVPLGIGVGAGANAASRRRVPTPPAREETVPLPWGRAPLRWVGACAPAGPPTPTPGPAAAGAARSAQQPLAPTGLVTSAPMSGSPPSPAMSSSSGRSSAWAAGRRCGDSPFAATPRSAAASSRRGRTEPKVAGGYAGATLRRAPGERRMGVGERHGDVVVDQPRAPGGRAARSPPGPGAPRGEVPAGEGRPADEAPHDVGVEASGRQQRRLHRDGDDLVGRRAAGSTNTVSPSVHPASPGSAPSTSSGRPPIADATSRRRPTSGPAAGRRGIGRQPSTLTKCLFLP